MSRSDIGRIGMFVLMPIFAIGIIISYMSLVSKKIDFVAEFLNEGRYAEWLAVACFASFLWYAMGRIFELYSKENLFIYPIVGIEIIVFFVLRYALNDGSSFIKSVEEVLLFAFERASSFWSVGGSAIYEAQAWAEMIPFVPGLLLILVADGVVFLGTLLGYAVILWILFHSPILATVIFGSVGLSFCGIVTYIEQYPILLVVSIVGLYVTFLIWSWLGSKVPRKDTKIDYRTSLNEWFTIERNQIIVLAICIVGLIICFSMGLFKSWTEVLNYMIPSEYSDMLDANLYENGSYIIMFIVSSAFSFGVGMIMDMLFSKQNNTVVLMFIKTIIMYLVQLLTAGWLFDSVNNIVFDSQTTSNALSVVLMILMTVCLVLFGLQGALTIFVYNVIFMIFDLLNINIEKLPVIVTGLLFTVLIKFLYEYLFWQVWPNAAKNKAKEAMGK